MTRVRCASLACLLIATLGASRQAEDDPKGMVLFDGKTLDGWKPTEFYKPSEATVEDGAIVIAKGHPMGGVTSTRADLPRTNYELSYEAQRLEGGDFFAAATFPVGKSYLTFVNGGWGGGVTGLSSLNGANASENETMRSIKFEPNTWYKFRIRVTEDVIRVGLDGKEIIAAAVEGRDVGVRVEMNTSKPLGFATYDTRGAVRDITIRSLTPAEVAEVKKVEPE